jgi:hypothetical protein
MKKLLSIMLGLALLTGTVSTTFGQSSGKKHGKGRKGGGRKGSGSRTCPAK